MTLLYIMLPIEIQIFNLCLFVALYMPYIDDASNSNIKINADLLKVPRYRKDFE
jgi:hypothetical protein